MKTLMPDYSPAYLDLCRDTLDSALRDVPAYGTWAAHDPGGGDPLVRLAALPLVDKAVMRLQGPARFVSPRYNLEAALASRDVEMVHTSGSTGDRVGNVWSQAWWNASEEASWELNAHARKLLGRAPSEALLASPLCVGVPCEDGYLDRSKRTLGRFLFLNERVDHYGWTAAHMDRMAGELRDFRPSVLEANPSYLARLCRYLASKKERLPAPALIVLTFENPSILHRRQIRAVFESPLASSYGSTESGYVFMECACGRLHQNTAFCHVDFIPFTPRHGGPGIGSILVTTFRNPWRVLLRFDIGDVVRLAAEPCPCGRRDGLTLEAIEGRAVNLTLTPGGEAVTQLAVDRAVSPVAGLADYQLLQTGPADYRFAYVPDAPGDDSPAESCRSALAGVYGRGARIRLERVDRLPPDPPGKCRLCKPLIPVEPRAFWNPASAPPGSFQAREAGS
jgi:phenylacetate-coenzyme A ligase PaaK-like adenylate-forming protein